MCSLPFLLIISIIIISQNPIAGIQHETSFLEHPYKHVDYGKIFSDPYKYEEDECVNLDAKWVNRANSFVSDSLCITLYTRGGCEGNSKDIITFTNAQKNLEKVDFDTKVASFRQCELFNETLLSMRTIYPYREVFYHGAMKTSGIRSGECNLFTPKQIFFQTFIDNCFTVYKDDKCKMPRYYSGDKLPHPLFDEVGPVGSVQTCQIMFHFPCNPPCPKFLHDGSFEYNFWTQFFSVFSPARRGEFENRVKRTDNGYISWDFLFTKDTPARSLGDQYRDVLQNLRSVLVVLEKSQPGAYGFNAENLEELLLLSNNLRSERRSQKNKMQKNMEDLNYIILLWLEKYWQGIEWSIDGIIRKWYPSNKNAGELSKITLWGSSQRTGISIDYTYKSKCVNLRPYWTKATKSIDPYDQCVRVYANKNCEGDSEILHPLSKGLDFLGEVNFDRRVASFKKCGSKVPIKTTARSQFYLPILYTNDQNSGVFGVLSDGCQTLPKEWHGHQAQVHLKNRCFVLYNNVDCKGKKVYVVSDYTDSSIKSFKTCDLNFQGQCDAQCPKFLYVGSSEYNFWMQLFTITSKSLRHEFEERVKRSTDGFISWDFLFAATTSSLPKNHQLYLDALESQIDMFRTLYVNQPNTLGFNEANLEQLLMLAERVKKERNEQKTKFWNNCKEKTNSVCAEHNFNIMVHLENTWDMIEKFLEKIIQVWYPRHSNGMKSQVTFWENDKQNGESITYAYEDKCVNLRSYWINKPRIISVANDQCVIVYTRANCQGDSNIFRSLSRDSVQNFNVDTEVASFKRCGSVSLRDRLSVRPNFHFTLRLHTDGPRKEEPSSVLSGECKNLTDPWRNKDSAFDILHSTAQCYLLFFEPNCGGEEDPEICNLHYHRGRSMRTCGLMLRAPCKPSCPKYLFEGSVEYNYWTYFLAIISPSRRDQFQDRVKRSTDGYILWDFLIPSNATAEYQYEDVFQTLLVFLNDLLVGSPDAMGFNEEKLNTLLVLASSVHKERDEQMRSIAGNYCRVHNYVIMSQLREIWGTVESLHEEIIRKWYFKHTINDGKLSNITFWEDSELRGESVQYPLREKCVNLRPYWVNRSSSIDTHGSCVTLFTNVNCRGYSASVYPRSRGLQHFGDIKLNDRVASFKKCAINLPIETDVNYDPNTAETRNLTIKPPCNPTCPKFLSVGSAEYAFWMHFFTVVSRSHRDQFEKRVGRSKNGYISWDFLLPAKSMNKSLGLQYLDAVESQRRIIRILRVSHPGRFGFNKENLETLYALAAQVHNERSSQHARSNDQNKDTLSFMKDLWNSIELDLKEIVQYWRNENSEDDCGLIGKTDYTELAQTDTLLNDASKAVYGNDPWHVAIYHKRSIDDDDPILICGGSLISATVVISAAHCFYDSRKKELRRNTTLYEIYAAKLKRDYDGADDDGEFKEKRKIREFIYPSNPFNPGKTGSFGADIALIILAEPFSINEYIRPVCLDWDNSIFGLSEENNLMIGRVVGWGANNTDSSLLTYSDDLLTADLKFISHEDCVGKLKYLNTDNFCGGGEKGPGVRKGDSGGGFVFKFTNRYYIRGLVSTNDKESTSSIGAFTDISLYISWIRNYV